MTEILCSVVIPTCARPRSLEAALRGLAEQTTPAQSLEVVVVLDGPDDASVDVLRSAEATGHLPNLRWHEQERSGQATALNAGVARARGPVVLFVDDDLVLHPRAVEAHLRHHREGRAVAVLGDPRIARRARTSLGEQSLWAWWEDFLTERSRPGRALGYRDFCAGNVSLRRSDFQAVGGFDEGFRGYGREDYELAYRLLRAGVRFLPEPDALADHHHVSSTAKRLGRKRHEAHGDVLIGRKHPELRRGLPLAHPPTGWRRRLVRIAFRHPDVATTIIDVWRRALPLLEGLRLRRLWTALDAALQMLVYWLGVADELGSWTETQRFLRETPEPPRSTLDVTDGVPEDAVGPWVDGPCLVDVTAHGRRLGRLEIQGPLVGDVRSHLAEEIARRPWSVLLLSERAPS